MLEDLDSNAKYLNITRKLVDIIEMEPPVEEDDFTVTVGGNIFSSVFFWVKQIWHLSSVSKI